MEIKTTQEITGRLTRPSEENVKWITIDSLIEYLNSNSFGYRDLGSNAIDGDKLQEELRK